jgi:hypothetical protein
MFSNNGITTIKVQYLFLQNFLRFNLLRENLVRFFFMLIIIANPQQSSSTQAHNQIQWIRRMLLDLSKDKYENLRFD